MILCTIFAVVIAGAAIIRLAPSDPADWHIDPTAQATTSATTTLATNLQDPGDCTVLASTLSGARATCLRPEVSATLLARLDRLALATPRTTRLAGSAETGRITWVTRSLIWGFPDYTTAQTTEMPTGTRLDVLARIRFGVSDLGVNRARLTAWLGAL